MYVVKQVVNDEAKETAVNIIDGQLPIQTAI